MAKEKSKKRPRLDKKTYEHHLAHLQEELVKLQEWVKQEGLKVVVLFEGRDAAGKGGVIKAIFFGNVIAVLGCYYGLHSPDGAEGVGKATTKTVVSSIIVIFILNAVLTFILY